MDFVEIKNTYLKLKELLLVKKEAIKTRNLESLHTTDEEITVLCEKISKYNVEDFSASFSESEKNELRTIANEIKEIEKNNEILIKHSLYVINDLLSGILNIAADKSSSYDSKGLGHNNTELDISSITEEA